MIGEVTQEKAVAFLSDLFETRDRLQSSNNLAGYTIERQLVRIKELEDGTKELETEAQQLREGRFQALKEREELAQDNQTLSEEVARLVQDKSWTAIQSEKKLLDKRVEVARLHKAIGDAHATLEDELI